MKDLIPIHPDKKRHIHIRFFIFFLMALLTLLGVWWYSIREQVIEEEPVFCTQDVKLCPDGSYVGRVGPNCEFAECPAL